MYFSKKRQNEEKRNEWRLSYTDFIVYFRKGNLVKKAGAGFGKDLSINGICFQTPVKFETQGELELVIELPSGFPNLKNILTKATVVRISPLGKNRWEVACKLNHVNHAHAEAIRQFLWWVEFQNGKTAA